MEQNAAQTNYRALGAEALLDALEYADSTPDLELIRVCLERQEELTPALLERLARPDDPEWPDEDPRHMAQIHAGLLLCAYREPAALPIFDQIYREHDVLNEGFADWFDSPLASYGPAVVPMMTGLLSDPNVLDVSQTEAISTLTTVAVRHPELRPSVIEQLRALLPPLDPETGEPQISPEENEHPPDVWTWAIQGLGDLRDLQSQEQILALFRNELIDEMMIGGEKEYLRHLNRPQSSDRYWLVLPPFDLLEFYKRLHQQAIRDAIMRAGATKQRSTTNKTPSTPSQPSQQKAQDFISTSLQPTVVRSQPKIGRNEPCPCGSGRKYKHCHGK